MLYPVILGLFYGLVVPMLWSPAAAAGCGAAYFLLHCWAARAAFAVMASDPADPSLRTSEEYRRITASGETLGQVPPKLPPPAHLLCAADHAEITETAEPAGEQPSALRPGGRVGGGPGCVEAVANVGGCAVQTCFGCRVAADRPSGVDRREPPHDASDFCYHCQVTALTPEDP